MNGSGSNNAIPVMKIFNYDILVKQPDDTIKSNQSLMEES